MEKMEQETCESYVLSELKKVKDECQGLQKENEEITKRDVKFLAGIRDGMEEKPDE